MMRWLWSLRYRNLPLDQTAALNRVAGKRVLVNEILSLQILITAVIGALAIAGLYFGGQWVLQKNYSRWALQWTEELHELGAPLYLPGDETVALRLESYIDRYPEIEKVTYFRLDGSAITSLAHRDSGYVDADFSLSEDQLARVSGLVGTEQPYLMESNLLNVRSFDIYAPIWTESIADDGLFDFNLLEMQDDNPVELVDCSSILRLFMTTSSAISSWQHWRC